MEQAYNNAHKIDILIKTSFLAQLIHSFHINSNILKLIESLLLDFEKIFVRFLYKFYKIKA